jgi:purine nucleosidase
MSDKCRRCPVGAVFGSGKVALAALCLSLGPFSPIMVGAQTASDSRAVAAEKVIIDTDVGIDIDDAFAIALALHSPELEILGLSTASGDTSARAKILDRMLGEVGRPDIPVVVGAPTISPTEAWPHNLLDLQGRYGENGEFAKASHGDAVEFIAEKLRQFPGQITLIAIGPLTNVAALMEKDPAAFGRLKRIVMMGGWIHSMENGVGQTMHPRAEYNIMIDIRSAQKVFQSEVPLYVIPLDSTRNLAMDEVKRRAVLTAGTPITDALAVLYVLWGHPTPVLFDAMPIASIVDPLLCPTEPLNIRVDDKGVTRVGEGTANARVCLRSDANTFFDYYMQRIVNRRPTGVL